MHSSVQIKSKVKGEINMSKEVKLKTLIHRLAKMRANGKNTKSSGVCRKIERQIRTIANLILPKNYSII